MDPLWLNYFGGIHFICASPSANFHKINFKCDQYEYEYCF